VGNCGLLFPDILVAAGDANFTAFIE
jgi:hypothetical protein